MSKVEEIQAEIGKLSAREMQEIRDWLENVRRPARTARGI
jgi:hypothetical protein